MQYFGVPTCPYCKKRVNLIRTWSLKRQGEYQCPRCGGISNIHLSPLIYVAALLALFTGGALYFFHKFVLDDISLETALQVFLPFAVFFLLSVFFVSLAKPVIKKVSRDEMGKKRLGRKPAAPQPQAGPVYYDQEDYVPQREHFTTTIPAQSPPRPAPEAPPARQPRPAVAPTAQQQQPQPPARRADATGATAYRQAPAQRQPAPPVQQARAPQPAPAPRAQSPAPIRPPVPVTRRPAQPAAPQPASVAKPPQPADDFFAKYDDPDYVQRRLREIQRKDG